MRSSTIAERAQAPSKPQFKGCRSSVPIGPSLVYLQTTIAGGVAELADALDLGSSSLTGVQVQLLSPPLIPAIPCGVAFATSRRLRCPPDSLPSHMSTSARFEAAYPYQDDVLALPVADIDAASRWYVEHFAMKEVERCDGPAPKVILERDGTWIGFAVNGGDPSQEGAAILVSNIHGMKEELEAKGVNVGNWRVDEQDGKKLQVFFVVAPDGLCYYFHEALPETQA